MVKAQTLHRTWTKIISHYITIFRQPKENLLSLGSGYLQTEALLITSAVISQVTASIPPLLPGLAIGEWAGLSVLEMINAFDPDYLSAQIS
jgi:hypothetical protein